MSERLDDLRAFLGEATSPFHAVASEQAACGRRFQSGKTVR